MNPLQHGQHKFAEDSSGGNKTPSQVKTRIKRMNACDDLPSAWLALPTRILKKPRPPVVITKKGVLNFLPVGALDWWFSCLGSGFPFYPPQTPRVQIRIQTTNPNNQHSKEPMAGYLRSPLPRQKFGEGTHKKHLPKEPGAICTNEPKGETYAPESGRLPLENHNHRNPIAVTCPLSPWPLKDGGQCSFGRDRIHLPPLFRYLGAIKTPGVHKPLSPCIHFSAQRFTEKVTSQFQSPICLSLQERIKHSTVVIDSL